jgi:2-iminobutanoate/2-iminopropanoate deaminase
VDVIETAEAPSHTGPVPQAVQADGWIYVSAFFGADPDIHVIPVDARAEGRAGENARFMIEVTAYRG